MITLKIKYITDVNSRFVIKEYRKQYSSVLRYTYNRRREGVSEKDCEKLIDGLNNIGLIKSYLKRCAVKNATQLCLDNDDKMIFGGRKNFIDRCKHKITKDEIKCLRLSKLFILGEANQSANRMIRLNEDIKSFTFKPNRNTSIKLDIAGCYKKYKKYLKQLFYLQTNKVIPITYQLDDEYLYLTFDETFTVKNRAYKFIKNRVFGIDLNPNYVGWSVVDWYDSKDFKVVKNTSNFSCVTGTVGTTSNKPSINCSISSSSSLFFINEVNAPVLREIISSVGIQLILTPFLSKRQGAYNNGVKNSLCFFAFPVFPTKNK